jgi:hypothetical protein
MKARAIDLPEIPAGVMVAWDCGNSRAAGEVSGRLA